MKKNSRKKIYQLNTDYASLEEKIGYHFSDRSLLLTALTHSSYANEKACVSYERLEFLGDSLLGFITAKHLYTSNIPVPEGKMSKVRAQYVCESALASVALKLGTRDYLLLGTGENQTGGRDKPSILADTIESIIAAIYLDGGIEPAESFIMDKVLSEVNFSAPASIVIKDNKSALQEYVQKDPDAKIEYQVLSAEGPDHDRTFTMGLFINGELKATGTGRSKRAAAQTAAGSFLREISEKPGKEAELDTSGYGL